MANYKSLADLLRRKFPEMSLRKVAELLGVEHTSVARWFSGKGGGHPTMDSCLRIAKACGMDPLEIFRFAGRKAQDFRNLYLFYQGRLPRAADLFAQDPTLASLVTRVERLYRRGMEGPLDSTLSQLEASWETRRADFELVLADAGAKAGCLVADHRRCSDDVVYRLDCSREEVENLLAGQGLNGWSMFSEDDYGVRLRLFIKDPSDPDPESIRSALGLWAFGLARLLDVAEKE